MPLKTVDCRISTRRPAKTFAVLRHGVCPHGRDAEQAAGDGLQRSLDTVSRALQRCFAGLVLEVSCGLGHPEGQGTAFAGCLRFLEILTDAW